MCLFKFQMKEPWKKMKAFQLNKEVESLHLSFPFDFTFTCDLAI